MMLVVDIYFIQTVPYYTGLYSYNEFKTASMKMQTPYNVNVWKQGHKVDAVRAPLILAVQLIITAIN